jgi:hypothetical protein
MSAGRFWAGVFALCAMTVLGGWLVELLARV